jgi:hypothetical protein
MVLMQQEGANNNVGKYFPTFLFNNNNNLNYYNLNYINLNYINLNYIIIGQSDLDHGY